MEIVETKNHKSLKTITFLANWMDTKFRIPGTDIKFGVDALLSLIPGLGDFLSTGMSIGIFGLILAKGVPFSTALKMMLNIILDAIISAVPFLGTIGDVVFKANTRNLKLLEDHLQQKPDEKYEYGIWWVFALTLVILGMILFVIVAVIWKFLGMMFKG